MEGDKWGQMEAKGMDPDGSARHMDPRKQDTTNNEKEVSGRDGWIPRPGTRQIDRLVITYHKLMISCDKTHWWWFEHQIYRHKHDVLTNSATLPTLE